MAIPTITTALMKSLLGLLNALIERADACYEQTGSAVYHVLEHMTRGALDPVEIQDVLIASQEEFCQYAPSHQRWLQLFAELIQHGGADVETFADNLWRAYLFRLGSAADGLWNDYPEIQRRVTIQTDRSLPRSWGDYIFPMQSFMGVIENRFLERSAAWEHLLTSEAVLDLLEAQETNESTQPSLQIEHNGGYYINAAGTLNSYLLACNERIAHIDPRGYPRSINRTVPLTDVYVPLRLIPMSMTNDSSHYVRYSTATYQNPDLQILREPLIADQLTAHAGLPILDVINRHSQVLILGVSGSGKSTILRFVAAEQVRLLQEGDNIQIEPHPDGTTLIRLMRRLPIYLDLAEYIDDYNVQPLEEYALHAASALIGNSEIEPLLSDLLRNGQCILLLDGLDQVATEEQRRLLTGAVTQAASHWRAAGNTVVVTSRFEGYTAAPLPPSFQTFVMRGLDRSQIGPYLLRWSLTLARMRRPLISDDDALRRAETETLSLVREVTANARLYNLVNTPLMLRMLVGVHRPGMLMTPQRIAIFQMIADALIREWRLPQSAAERPSVLEQDVTELLGELAYWLQASRPTGLLSEQELRDILSHIWGEMHPAATPTQVNEAIEGFLQHMRLNPGVLTELAPQRYGFIYQALQEYFAARYLVSSYRSAPSRIRSYVHNPRWDEVIRLAVGFTSLRSREDASDLIEAAILARGKHAEQHDLNPSPFEELLHRDLFCAARLLGSGIEVGTELAKQIATSLMHLWLDGDRDSVGRFSLLFDSARRHLVLLDGTSASWHALQIARDALTSPSEYRRAYAIEAVTFWPSHMTEARDALVQSGKEAPSLVKMAIAGALGRVGALDIHAYRLLLNLVSDPDERVSERAQQSLVYAAPVPTEALSMWIEFLRSGNPTRRRISLRVLGRMGVLPSVVINELLLLVGDSDPEIRQSAVDVLAGVRNLPENVLTAICRAAQDTTASTETRITAIHALRRPIELPREVIDLLVDWTYDPDAAVRRAAIDALGECRNLGSDVIDALIERLNDPVDSVRACTAEPLARKGALDRRVMHVMGHAVRDPIHTVRCAIASALRLFTTPNEDVQNALRALLNDRDMQVREAALETVAHMENPGEETIEYLISLTSVQEFNIGAKAVNALARMRNLHPHALKALISALRVHWQTGGEAIAECLRAHHPLSQDAIHELTELAVHTPTGYSVQPRVPTGLRALALEVLGCTMSEAPNVLRILMQAALSPESPVEVRVSALRGLSQMRAVPTGAKEELLELLLVGSIEVRSAAAIAMANLVRGLPDPPFSGDEMISLGTAITGLMNENPPRASWELDNRAQNDLLMALDWVIARARPALPRLSSQLGEDLSR